MNRRRGIISLAAVLAAADMVSGQLPTAEHVLSLDSHEAVFGV